MLRSTLTSTSSRRWLNLVFTVHSLIKYTLHLSDWYKLCHPHPLPPLHSRFASLSELAPSCPPPHTESLQQHRCDRSSTPAQLPFVVSLVIGNVSTSSRRSDPPFQLIDPRWTQQQHNVHRRLWHVWTRCVSSINVTRLLTFADEPSRFSRYRCYPIITKCRPRPIQLVPQSSRSIICGSIASF